MSGYAAFNMQAFDAVRDAFTAQGIWATSPADMVRNEYPDHDFSTGKVPQNFNLGYMLIKELDAIRYCSAVYMLRGWEWSRGANLEREFARLIGKRILYETDGLAVLKEAS